MTNNKFLVNNILLTGVRYIFNKFSSTDKILLIWHMYMALYFCQINKNVLLFFWRFCPLGIYSA